MVLNYIHFNCDLGKISVLVLLDLIDCLSQHTFQRLENCCGFSGKNFKMAEVIFEWQGLLCCYWDPWCPSTVNFWPASVQPVHAPTLPYHSKQQPCLS